MKFITVLAALAAAPAVLANLTINTPTGVDTCEPTQFSWSNGNPPYYLSIVPAGQIAATPIEQFPTQNSTSYTWTVNLAQGTSITVALKDSTGATAYSDIITIQAGTTDSCVNGSGSSTPSTTGSGAGASSNPTGTSAGSSASASSTSSASGSSSSKSSGAGHLGVSSAFGVAAVMGLIGAALF